MDATRPLRIALLFLGGLWVGCSSAGGPAGPFSAPGADLSYSAGGPDPAYPAGGPDPANPPATVVVDIAPCGLGRPKEWQTSSAIEPWFNPCNGNATVNLATMLVYNSRLGAQSDPAVAQRGFGWGWNLEGWLGTHLVGYDHDGRREMRVVFGDLSTLTFVAIPGPAAGKHPCDGDFADPAAQAFAPREPYVTDRLYFSAAENTWVLRRADWTQMRFSASPRPHTFGILPGMGVSNAFSYDLDEVRDANGVTRKQVHDPSTGQLLHAIDGWGNVTDFAWDGGKLRDIVAPGGYKLHLVHDGEDLSAVVYAPREGPEFAAGDPEAPADHVLYDAHRPVTVTPAGRPPSHWEFDPAGRLSQMTDRTGAVLRVAYEGFKVTTFDRNDRKVTVLGFRDNDSEPRVIHAVTDDKGYQDIEERDGRGYLVSHTDVRSGLAITYEPSDAPSGTVKVTVPTSTSESLTTEIAYGAEPASFGRPVRRLQRGPGGAIVEDETIAYYDGPYPAMCWAAQRPVRVEKSTTGPLGKRVDVLTNAYEVVAGERVITASYNNNARLGGRDTYRGDGRALRLREENSGVRTEFAYEPTGFISRVESTLGGKLTMRTRRYPDAAFPFLPRREEMTVPRAGTVHEFTQIQFFYDRRGNLIDKKQFRNNELKPRKEWVARFDSASMPVDVMEFDRAVSYDAFLGVEGAMASVHALQATYWPSTGVGTEPGPKVAVSRQNVTIRNVKELNFERWWLGHERDTQP